MSLRDLFLIIVITLITGGCATANGTRTQSTASDGDVITTYDDPDHGLRLTYPGNWQEQTIPFTLRPKGTIIVLTAADASLANTQMPPTISVIHQGSPSSVQASNSSDQHLDNMQQLMIDKATKQFESFKLISSSPASLGGEPARRIVYTGTKVGVHVQVMNVIALHNGRGFSLAYSADPEIFSARLPAVQQVIDSVQWAK